MRHRGLSSFRFRNSRGPCVRYFDSHDYFRSRVSEAVLDILAEIPGTTGAHVAVGGTDTLRRSSIRRGNALQRFLIQQERMKGVRLSAGR